MARAMEIPIIRNRDWRVDDTLQIEVDSTVQNDRILPWSGASGHRGYGYGTPEQTGYGIGRGLAYGHGVYGAGYYGQGADHFVHRTISEFVAGDYSVRLRAVDVAGNAGSWSAAFTVEHRPCPPAVSSMSIDESTSKLEFTWSDP